MGTFSLDGFELKSSHKVSIIMYVSLTYKCGIMVDVIVGIYVAIDIRNTANIKWLIHIINIHSFSIELTRDVSQFTLQLCILCCHNEVVLILLTYVQTKLQQP